MEIFSRLILWSFSSKKKSERKFVEQWKIFFRAFYIFLTLLARVPRSEEKRLGKTRRREAEKMVSGWREMIGTVIGGENSCMVMICSS